MAGLVLSLGIAVGRAHLLSIYLHGITDFYGWLGAPLALGPLVGAGLALAQPRLAARAGVGAFAGLLAGATTGALAGMLLGSGPVATWAGGVIGAAVGTLAGGVGGAWLARRRGSGADPDPGRRRSGLAAWTALFLSLGCSPAGEGLVGEGPALVEPSPAEVEAVVLFVGDPGQARERSHPILRRVRSEVERWAAAIDDDSVVAVVILGDIIYPDGLHPAGHALRERDSLRLVDQIGLVAGPAARRRGAHALFVAGNHDWGRKKDREGAVRLKELERFLDAWRTKEGVAVSLEPEAGTGGPAVVDLGRRLRLLLLDTAWWLLGADEARKDSVIDRVAGAIRAAGDREVVIAAHHPFQSAGPHAALDAFGGTLGLRFLLSRSGAMLQDLSSAPYRELRDALVGVFAELRPPVLFAGGHEHSLQVIRGLAPGHPETTLVSGSASKLSDVGRVAGLRFARSAPGYARLVVRKDGGLALFVEAAPERFLRCPGEPRERWRCMEAGTAAYRTVWSGRL